ncbi:MAG: hypothetical protein RL276_517 [Bacteroidota bacterium]|jgi:uncharacterized protein
MRLLALLLLLSAGLHAQPWEKPSPSEGLVVWRGVAPVLQADEEARLESVLTAINDSTSTQITVLFVDRVNDDLNFVAAQTGEAWGIGQAETDNGMLVLIALDDRKMAIQVGRGLEPTITDLVSHQLIENTLKPAFREQAYAAGLEGLATEVAQRLSGQFEAVASEKERRFPVGAVLVAVLAFIVLARRSNSGGWGGGSGSRGMWFGPMGGFPSGGGFGGRSGGGFGGGGFGGFGGGSFGGGGASGSW